MTEFQKYCKRNPDAVLHSAFEKFLEYYPDIPKKKAKQEFRKQVSELFCNKYIR